MIPRRSASHDMYACLTNECVLKPTTWYAAG
jgi:hypothetical protein